MIAFSRFFALPRFREVKRADLAEPDTAADNNLSPRQQAGPASVRETSTSADAKAILSANRRRQRLDPVETPRMSRMARMVVAMHERTDRGRL
jgi:hypothetical protein